MRQVHVADRAAYAAAVRLIEEHGVGAEAEAARRAAEGRDRENVISFCHWRQTARTVAMLRSPEMLGSVH